MSGVVTEKGANILELGKEVAGASAEFMKAVPQGINVDRIADFTVHVDKIELGLLGLGPNGILAAARFN